MTEEEAKTKWCPFVRLATVEGMKSFNRLVVGKTASLVDGMDNKCIASACMAWRNLHMVRNAQGGYDYPEGEGYCGLAGKP